jgi:DNA-binding response OmpR family regulator
MPSAPLDSLARGHVLVIEDNPESADLLRAVLEEEGFQVLVERTARDGIEAAELRKPQATLLDWVLPDAPGLDVCRQLRREDRLMPVMFVSARDDEASIVRAFEAGADDFVSKPFQRAELVARLEAHIRKVSAVAVAPTAPSATPRNVIQCGDVMVDLDARSATVGGHEVSLGPLEFQLLAYFARNPGIAVSRDQILEHVYGYDAELATERVDLLVRRLRAKLGEGPKRGGQIVAVPGYGFRLDRRIGSNPPVDDSSAITV